MASIFRNILYVCRGLDDESHGLAQALELAGGEGKLDLLLLAPELGGELERYRESFANALRDALRDSLEKAVRQSGRRAAGDSRIDVESDEMPALRIIRRVQREAADLVVKQAESPEEGRGFRALDMELLRKCPSPVWLWRPRRSESGSPHIAVAVDPQSRQRAGRELALDLLKTSASLAQALNGRLSVVSCWQDEGEEFLRSTLRASVPEDELLRVSRELQVRHRRELDALLREAGVGGVSVQRRHGRPQQMIPAFITEEAVDLLVMGTVARTGIPGFIIGNTAENILQKVDCSLLALKPPGFASPVKAI